MSLLTPADKSVLLHGSLAQVVIGNFLSNCGQEFAHPELARQVPVEHRQQEQLP